MDTITLPNTTIQQAEDGSLLLHHRKTGLLVDVSQKRLDAWAIKILRESVSTDGPADEKANTGD